MSFFDLVIDPDLLWESAAVLSESRGRKCPPTVTLAMFLGRVLSAGSSSRNAVNEVMVNQLLRGMEPGSANTGSYNDSRKRLPQVLVQELARSTAMLMGTRATARWMWGGQHMVDGTTVLLNDTAGQERYLRYGSQKAGAGVSLAAEGLFQRRHHAGRKLFSDSRPDGDGGGLCL